MNFYEKKPATTPIVGDEGGYAPNLKSAEDALAFVMKAIEAAGYKQGEQISLALDVAASEFYDKESRRFVLAGEGGRTLTAEELVDSYATLTRAFPLVSIEDGMAEDDWDGWKLLTERLGANVQLVGDDLFVTNPVRLQQGIDRKIANSILDKVNQIGTLTETLEAVRLAQHSRYRAVISHRSGETADTPASTPGQLPTTSQRCKPWPKPRASTRSTAPASSAPSTSPAALRCAGVTTRRWGSAGPEHRRSFEGETT